LKLWEVGKKIGTVSIDVFVYFWILNWNFWFLVVERPSGWGKASLYWRVWSGKGELKNYNNWRPLWIIPNFSKFLNVI
jgi:hypothetical protein